jgi:hypothetical protein
MTYGLSISNPRTFKFGNSILYNTLIENNLESYTGARGIQGSQGLQGYYGSQGLRGLQGPSNMSTGSLGLQGNQGFVGLQGNQGFVGLQGNQGFIGLQGNQGFIGLQGNQGFVGLQGNQGLVGLQGNQGLVGLQGNQGFIGLQGNQGFVGLQGNQGLVGLQGNQGLVGLQGNQGLSGLQGNQGLSGLQGNQGLVGLQGNQGLVGLQGNQGLVGLQGNQGFAGLQGNQGLVGLQGNQGLVGLQGNQGLVGLQGNQGLSGLQGNQGFAGLQGNQGLRGATGSNSLWVSAGTNVYYTGGNVGIGTINPVFPLHIESLIDNFFPGFTVLTPNVSGSSYGPSFSLGKRDSTRESFSFSYAHIGSNSISNNFTILINGVGSGFSLYADRTIQMPGYTTNGTLQTINSNGTLSVSSDVRLKNSIESLTGTYINSIMNLNPVSFKYNQDPFNTHLGFIAQEVEQIIPLAVDGKKNDYDFLRDERGNLILDVNGMPQEDPERKTPRYRGLNTTALVAVLTKAIQEQKVTIDSQQQIINNLLERVTALENRN